MEDSSTVNALLNRVQELSLENARLLERLDRLERSLELQTAASRILSFMPSDTDQERRRNF